VEIREKKTLSDDLKSKLGQVVGDFKQNRAAITEIPASSSAPPATTGTSASSKGSATTTTTVTPTTEPATVGV